MKYLTLLVLLLNCNFSKEQQNSKREKEDSNLLLALSLVSSQNSLPCTNIENGKTNLFSVPINLCYTTTKAEINYVILTFKEIGSYNFEYSLPSGKYSLTTVMYTCDNESSCVQLKISQDSSVKYIAQLSPSGTVSSSSYSYTISSQNTKLLLVYQTTDTNIVCVANCQNFNQGSGSSSTLKITKK